MKSMMKSAVVGAVAAAFVASVAVAQGQGPGPQGRGGRGPGMGGPGGPARGLMQGLTEEQRQQVKAIMARGATRSRVRRPTPSCVGTSRRSCSLTRRTIRRSRT